MKINEVKNVYQNMKVISRPLSTGCNTVDVCGSFAEIKLPSL
jgi:hypothetical protein